MVICQHFAESLRGSWRSSNLSYMSFGHPNVETLPVYNEMCRKLLFNKLSIVCNIKILLMTFCQEGPQMCVQSFMRIGEIAWEEDKIF